MTEEGLRWVRVSRGLYLLGIGIFLLLTTQEILPWSFWSEAVAYWPVLLVAIGIRLVFERGRAPWLVLLGPLLVFGTLTGIAWRGPGRAATAVEWVPIRIERPTDVSAWTLEGRLALARLDVGSRRLQRGVLLDGRATQIGRGSVRATDGAAPGVVRLTNAWHDRALLALPGAERPRCEVGVTTAAPLTLDLDLAFTTTRLDLAAGAPARLAIGGAFNDLSLRLGQPPAEVRLALEGAFNRLVIEVPPATPLYVSREGLLNVVDERPAGDVPRSERRPDGAPGYRLNLEGAFNRVVVRSG